MAKKGGVRKGVCHNQPRKGASTRGRHGQGGEGGVGGGGRASGARGSMRSRAQDGGAGEGMHACMQGGHTHAHAYGNLCQRVFTPVCTCHHRRRRSCGRPPPPTGAVRPRPRRRRRRRAGLCSAAAAAAAAAQRRAQGAERGARTHPPTLVPPERMCSSRSAMEKQVASISSWPTGVCVGGGGQGGCGGRVWGWG